MKFIKPSEISGKLMTLIDECDEKLILISPYVKISKWYKLIKKIQNLKERKIDFNLYVREDKNNFETYNDLNELGLEFKTIPNLHAKLYMNEKYAIVTSMNMLLSSEINSLEIGYISETREEYNELLDYVNRYVSPTIVKSLTEKKATTENYISSELDDWQSQFCELIAKDLDQDIKAWPDEHFIRITTKSNNYECFIHTARKKNNLRMIGIISEKEFDFIQDLKKQLEETTNLKIELYPRKNNHYCRVFGELSDIKSNFIHALYKADRPDVVKAISQFVINIDKIKLQVQNIK